MKAVTVTLKSISPYSQSKGHQTTALDKEGKDDYDKRTWRERIHADAEGNVFIPPMAFKNGLSEIAKFLSVSIPGKGKATYTKHFEAGILVMDPVMLGLKKDQIAYEDLFVPADGQRGSGKRVWRRFPLIPTWTAKVTVHIVDDTITKPVFERHMHEFGKFIGIGRFRPRNNGFYGRFVVSKFEWAE